MHVTAVSVVSAHYCDNHAVAYTHVLFESCNSTQIDTVAAAAVAESSHCVTVYCLMSAA
jgi:hypothetical protein